MSTIITRSGKGSALTFNEVDDNFTNLNTDKYQSGNNVAFGTISASGISTFSAGSAGSPAITTTGDTNTGIFFPAADTIAFSEGGTESMRIDASGNLGLGTTSPTEKLSVSGGIVATGSAALSSGAGAYLYYTAGTTSAELTALSPAVAWLNQKYNALSHQFSTSGTERMRLDSSGNLGIGVTPSAWSSSQRALQIKDNSGLTGAVYAGFGAIGIASNVFYNGTNNLYIGSGFASSYEQINGQHTWKTAPSGIAGTSATLTQAMTLDSSGNLSVGGTTALLSASGRGNVTINGSTSSILNFGCGIILILLI